VRRILRTVTTNNNNTTTNNSTSTALNTAAASDWSTFALLSAARSQMNVQDVPAASKQQSQASAT
jgi:hypothetical protein